MGNKKTKAVKIAEGETFILGSQIFTYSITESGGISIKVSNTPNLYDPKTVTKVTKNFTPPTISEVEAYFKEKGYSSEGAKKAFDYYTAGDWKDSSGKQVKNWKQKMLGVWMRPEYLIKPASGSNNNFFQE